MSCYSSNSDDTGRVVVTDHSFLAELASFWLDSGMRYLSDLAEEKEIYNEIIDPF